MNAHNNKLNLLQPLILILLVCSAFTPALAQKERKEIREGNTSYEKGKYSDAETSYRKALDKNSHSFPGSYNLGGAMYRQKKYDEAIQQYQRSAEKTTDPVEKANSYHNLGNAYLQSQQYQESIDAYRQSLKLNPGDNETRYNMAYAQAMLKKQQQEQQQNKDQQNKNQQSKDKKDQQSKDKQDQQQQSNDQQQDQKQQKEQQKAQAQKQPKISKEDAERILQALKNDEQKLQEKMARKEGERIKIDKNW